MILTRKDKVNTMNKIPKGLQIKWKALWDLGTDKDDKNEFPYEDFLGDFICEVMYRQSCNGVADGNWTEFKLRWKLLEQDYENMLQAMTEAGFNGKIW